MRGRVQGRWRGTVSINVRMTDVCKRAVEPAGNGLLAPELANGVSRVKGVASKGIRLGNWMSLKQAQTLLNTPDIATITRKRACGYEIGALKRLSFPWAADRGLGPRDGKPLHDRLPEAVRALTLGHRTAAIFS